MFVTAELPKDRTASQHARQRTGRSWQSSSWYWWPAATTPATSTTAFAPARPDAAGEGQSQPRGEPTSRRSEERQPTTTCRLYGEFAQLQLFETVQIAIAEFSN